jgi:hypothetical protein
MRRIALTLLAALILTPAFAGDEVKVHVGYLGQGVFSYKKKAYVYDALVGAIQADHVGEHIDIITVDMGTVASQADKAKVCQLRQALLTQVKMHITVDDEKRELFCN